MFEIKLESDFYDQSKIFFYQVEILNTHTQAP